MTDPIRVPGSPFWAVFRRFGRDELTGAVIALIATAALELYFHFSGLTISVLLLALAGPVVEKVGFFYWHIKEAYDTYRTTLPADRAPFSVYAKSAFRGGCKTLIQDVLVHDPLYVLLMFGGMSIHPATPAWLLVPIAFGVAVVAVALLEVGFTELRYRWFQRNLFRHSFKKESYLESRFYLEDSADPKEVLEQLRQAFVPNAEPFTLNYLDTYCDVDLPSFNGRSPKVRYRVRDRRNVDTPMTTTQIIYTRAEEQEAGPTQFRFFPSSKDKFYSFEQDALEFAGLKVGELTQQIYFTRRIVQDPKRLFISVDTIRDSGTVVEIKAYTENAQLLKEAMRFIMHRFPVLQTTQVKADLLAEQAK